MHALRSPRLSIITLVVILVLDCILPADSIEAIIATAKIKQLTIDLEGNEVTPSSPKTATDTRHQAF